jgi:DNA polymerase-3 subunit chi
MTRVDFYILGDPGLDAGLRFSCKLAAQIAKDNTPLHISVDDMQRATELDELMWDYPRHRFLPHKIVAENIGKDETSAEDCLIHIGTQEPLVSEGVLINLGTNVPAFFGRFERVAEIVVGETKEAGRARFRHYRERGYPLYDHHLTDWEQAN